MFFLIPISSGLIIFCLLILFGVLNINVFGTSIWEWFCIVIFCAIFGYIAKILTIIEAFILSIFNICLNIDLDNGNFLYYFMLIINFFLVSFIVLRLSGGI